MNNGAQKNWDLLIIPCWGESYLARIVAAAAEELAGRDQVRVIGEKEVGDLQAVLEAIDKSDRCITVDGCESRCMMRKMAGHQCKTEFELVLTDMGIEDLEQTHLLVADLDLAKDAILAASTRISPKHPVFPGCCC